MCFLLLDPGFVAISLSSPARGSKISKNALAASGDGHTLRCHDPGMILAWHGN